MRSFARATRVANTVTLRVDTRAFGPRFGEKVSIFEIEELTCNNEYLQTVVDNFIFGISVPDYPIEPLKPCFWDSFQLIIPGLSSLTILEVLKGTVDMSIG